MVELVDEAGEGVFGVLAAQRRDGVVVQAEFVFGQKLDGRRDQFFGNAAGRADGGRVEFESSRWGASYFSRSFRLRLSRSGTAMGAAIADLSSADEFMRADKDARAFLSKAENSLRSDEGCLSGSSWNFKVVDFFNILMAGSYQTDGGGAKALFSKSQLHMRGSPWPSGLAHMWNFCIMKKKRGTICLS